MIRQSLRTIALTLGLSAAGAAQAQPSIAVCVSGDEAEGLVLALAPDLLQAVGRSCAGSLPANSLLRNPSGAFTARYRAAADESWGRARSALLKLAGPDAAAIVTSDYARPLLTSLIVPSLTKDLKPRDCPAIDRILSTIEPLPPRNTARLIVTILQLTADDDRAKGKKPPLPICPTDAP